jgi:hypothetical protein
LRRLYHKDAKVYAKFVKSVTKLCELSVFIKPKIVKNLACLAVNLFTLIQNLKPETKNLYLILANKTKTMKLFTFLFSLFTLTLFAQNNKKYETFFEKGNGNQSASYQETIQYYQLLARDFSTIQIKEMGLTDSGEPLHMITYNPDKEFDFEKIQKNKAVLFINNGIHAGEPDGIDATMQFY